MSMPMQVHPVQHEQRAPSAPMTDGITGKRCHATGKKRFSTYRKASAELASCEFQRRRLGRVYRMERSAYLCDHCDSWHLTSKPREAGR